VAWSEKEDDYIQPSQHGFRAHRGTDTALSQLVNAMEHARWILQLGYRHLIYVGLLTLSLKD
jgi:hypothetical protein